MTPYHIIGLLVGIIFFLLFIIYRQRKPTATKRTTRYKWISINNEVVTSDKTQATSIIYTDKFKSGLQEYIYLNKKFDKFHVEQFIDSLNTAWILHGIAFNEKEDFYY